MMCLEVSFFIFILNEHKHYHQTGPISVVFWSLTSHIHIWILYQWPLTVAFSFYTSSCSMCMCNWTMSKKHCMNKQTFWSSSQNDWTDLYQEPLMFVLDLHAPGCRESTNSPTHSLSIPTHKQPVEACQHSLPAFTFPAIKTSLTVLYQLQLQ